MTTKITKIKKLSFVPYQEVVDQDIMWILRRNEIKIDGERMVEFNPYNNQGATQAKGVFGDLVEEMYDFCNDNCKGIWTYTFTAQYGELVERPMSYGGKNETRMDGVMRVYFEMREDRDLFMKNHILLAKLMQE